MSRSRVAVIREKLRARFDEKRRYIPMWAQLQLWERDDERHPVGKPGRLLPKIYGGLWDEAQCRYVEGAKPRKRDIFIIPVHAGQLEIIEFTRPKLMGLLLIGGPGSGKTRIMSVRGLVQGLEHPGEVRGMVGATSERVDVIAKDLLDVIPPQWIRRRRESRGREIQLWNRHTFELVGGQEPSKRTGSKIQGRSWYAADVDELQNVSQRALDDTDERGRRVGTDYCVFGTATNFGLGHFELTKQLYKTSPYHALLRLDPLQNVFVPLDYWERFKSKYSDGDFRRRILAEDIPPDELVYSRFSYADTVRPAPRDKTLDITRQETARLWGKRFSKPQGWDWVNGTDFGALRTVTIWLKCFREPNTGERLWWAMRETTSERTRSDVHARKLATIVNPADFIVVGDPGINTKDVDLSDYVLMQREGLTVVPAYGMAIRRLHRVNMFNALLEAADGKRRFFIDIIDEARTPACPQLIMSCMSQVWGANGDPEAVRKDYSDPTHWPAAAQYGVFPFEQIRGQTTFDRMTGAADPLLVEAQEIWRRQSERGY